MRLQYLCWPVSKALTPMTDILGVSLVSMKWSPVWCFLLLLHSPIFWHLLNDWSRMSSEGGCSSPWPSEDTLQATVNGWRTEEWMICSCKFSPRVCLHWLLKWAECQTNEVKPNGAQKVKQKLTGSTTTGTTRPDVTVVYCFVHFNYTKLRLRNI